MRLGDGDSALYGCKTRIPQAISRLQKLLRVLWNPLNQHFKMKMRTGRATTDADLGNFLTTFDQITFFYQYP